MSRYEAPAGVVIEVDPRTLRERIDSPSDHARLAAWCEENPGHALTVPCLRVLGDLERAAQAGAETLADPDLPPLARAARRARYAHVLHWQGRFEQAEEQFAQALADARIEESSEESRAEDERSALVRASILQHRAKSRWDQGRGEEAAVDAQQALTLRERCDAGASLLASSRETLAAIMRTLPSAAS